MKFWYFKVGGFIMICIVYVNGNYVFEIEV